MLEDTQSHLDPQDGLFDLFGIVSNCVRTIADFELWDMFSDSLGVSAHIFDKALEGNSRSEVSSPKCMFPVCIREEIISFDGIGSFFFLDGSDVVSWSWV